MAIDLFAGVAVNDLAVAVDWYARLLGAAPAFYPNEIEAVWEIDRQRHLYVKAAPERAGHAMHLLFVDDLEHRIHAIRSRGIDPISEETYDQGVSKVTFRDPDGNEISFGGPTS